MDTVPNKVDQLFKAQCFHDRKQYELSSLNFKKVLPYQKEVFWYKAKFIRKILNLLVIVFSLSTNKKRTDKKETSFFFLFLLLCLCLHFIFALNSLCI